MFDKEKYITSHANEILPLALQITIWQSIDQWRATNTSLDYLQVFELSTETVGGKSIQVIIHSQEQPEKTATIRIKCESFEPVNDKVFVIDDGEYATMLMASDY
ncbi:MAG: hypothetical protein KIC94_12280 [Clostridiales bacterium]|nr:hypothetical protein [Clostridiales bacterium]